MANKDWEKFKDPYVHLVVHIPVMYDATKLLAFCKENGLDVDFDPDPGMSETYCSTCGCPGSEHFAGGNGAYCPDIRGL